MAQEGAPAPSIWDRHGRSLCKAENYQWMIWQNRCQNARWDGILGQFLAFAGSMVRIVDVKRGVDVERFTF